MKDALDQLLFEVRRERRVQARERREERARNRHKIPEPEAQGKPDRWHPTVSVLLVHSSGRPIGLFIELHHEVHPEWRRLQPAPTETAPDHTEIVSGSGWFEHEVAVRPDSPDETIALRERLIELLNAAQAEYRETYSSGNDLTGAVEDEARSISILPP